MRIAMLTNNYKPFIGGVPISIERLSEGLRSLGHEVYIFAPTYKNQEEEPYVVRYKSSGKPLKGGIIVPSMLDISIEKHFKQMEFDLIHVHHPVCIGWIGLYLGKKYNIPVVYTYHTRYEQYLHYLPLFNKWEESNRVKKPLNYIKNKTMPNLLSIYAKQCDAVFAPTNLMKDILEDMGVDNTIELLPTGLNEKFFTREDDEAEALRKMYKGDKDYLFCTVSRLSKEKNITFIIEGLQKLKREIGNSFRTLVIGDGPLRAELEVKVQNLGLSDNIVFLKSVENERLGHYYKACDLFLFASKSETQGIVLLEAMAAGIPVVAVRASGVIDIVKNGINGSMTDENQNLWVGAIKEMIENKPMMANLKTGAYRTAMRYSSEKVAELAQMHYEHAIKNRTGGERYAC